MNLVSLLDRLTNLSKLDDAQLAQLEADVVECFNELDTKPTDPDRVKAMTSVANAHQSVLTELEGRATKPPTPPAVRNPAAFNSQGRPTPPREQRSRASMIDRYGTAIETSAGLADVMTKSFTEASRSGGRVAVMSAKWSDSYPDSQRFTGNVVSDTQKVDAQRAVVASGGICNPVPVDYSIDTIAIADRPLRDGLPGFDASRGGVQFIPPVTLASTNSATGIWTEAIDANPGTATKPIMRIDCGDSQEAIVDAIPTRLLIGNMMGRFSPEQVDNVTSTALAQAARVAETFLLSKISTNSTRVSAAQLLGASRDLVATIELATAAYRYRQRAGDQLRMTAVLPAWAKNLVRADLARELAHDTSGGDPLAVSDARIAAWFSARNVSPIWTLDGAPAVSGAIPSGFQGFGTQPTNAALLDWPHALTWWLFSDGSFDFLDGGRLEMSVVRDSQLNSTNDYEVFIESFEGLSFRGLESLEVVSAVRPNGASSASVTI